MEVANKTCKSNPNCNDCSECMKGSPYRFCCKDECGEHEFCRGCAYRDGRKQIRDSIGENGGKYVRCRDDANAQSYTC